MACAAAEAGGSLFEAVPEAGDPVALEANIRELGEISRRSGLACTIQPIIYLPTIPDLWRRTLGWLSEEAARGARIFGQSPPGPMDFNLRLDETFFTFFLLPAWGDVMRHPAAERAPLLRDPDRRPALREQGKTGLELFLPNAWIGETYSEANVGLVGRRLFDVAEERGVDPVDALIDISLEDDLHTAFAIRAPMHGSKEIAEEILRHDRVMVGASDAGAHLTQFCGAGDATYFLSEYVRERGVFSLEQAVYRLTGQAADLLGLEDRGRIEVGSAADLVLFDIDRLDPGPEHFVRDLPGGGHRYLRRPVGIDAVWVAGRRIVEGGEYTDARPGRIV